MLIWSAPIRDEHGNITQAIEMITDITQIRKLQDRLTSLGLLLGTTAHGIKGLLTGIDGAVYRLGSGLEKRNFERMEDGYNDLQFLTGRVKQTVMDILYYAKNRELNWASVDAGQFSLDLYASFAAKAKSKDITFDLDMGAVLGRFDVDKGILASALGNIIENAIDACTPGKGRVTFKVFGDAKQVAFRIADNGVGMDPETKEKLFTLFFSSKEAPEPVSGCSWRTRSSISMAGPSWSNPNRARARSSLSVFHGKSATVCRQWALVS